MTYVNPGWPHITKLGLHLTLSAKVRESQIFLAGNVTCPESVLRNINLNLPFSNWHFGLGLFDT